ncbi:MAG: aldehyde dehydrogenase family protein, partial [Caulobacteraceae bacterium]|nr:aldehyde dehydrogenase family protein [Caulobacteraceae bacterium]
MIRRLEWLEAGMAIPFGGDRLAVVPDALARAFAPGDRLIVVQTTGDLLHVPAAAQAAAADAVDQAAAAFDALGSVGDDAVGAFFNDFAARLANDEAWARIAAANADDVDRARDAGRPVGRLKVGEAMRAQMIAGLRGWRDAASPAGQVVERRDHDGWRVEEVKAPLGVVGFVFEGRPNVFADAAGVIRSGATAVFRIGSDALGTARAIRDHALAPALAGAGLPAGAAVLLDSAERAAGWALFADPRLALAVARGSGPAVAQLGAVARQAGTPVSLHGTGGAWLIADETADARRFEAAVAASLDRKVCNTLNVCCIVRSRAADLIPAFQRAIEGARLHVVAGSEGHVPAGSADVIPEAKLAHEWEWDDIPELTLALVDDLDQAIDLFNRYSPRFAVSLVSSDPVAHERLYATAHAPFVGDGFTRWVDGQYAWERPELGLSNWQG